MERQWRYALAFTLLLIAAYAAILWQMHWLRFPLSKDELHFWPTSLLFSHSLIPDLHTLRAYNELSTPLPFWIFGQLERWFGNGLVLARYLNLLLSAVLLVMIGCVRGKPDRNSVLASIGLMLFPYFLGVATHAYTDTIAAFFATLGMLLHLRRRYTLAVLSWILGISARQYIVVFPIATAVYEGWRFVSGDKDRGRSPAAWLWPLVASSSLGAWFIFFGGFGPPQAIAAQHIATVSLRRLDVDHALYFLACIGLYYCLPEAILFPRPLRHYLPSWRLALAVMLPLAVLFLLFPPLKNVAYYVPPTMGYFDIAARRLLPDVGRVTLFYLFAAWALVRLVRPYNSLAGWLLLANAAVMVKAHIAWDKYATPLLCVLWLFRAYDSEALGFHGGLPLESTRQDGSPIHDIASSPVEAQ